MKVKAAQALEAFRKSNAAWPENGGDLYRVFRPVLNPKFTIEPGASIFTIGSCFARNIERTLDTMGFDVPAFRFPVPPAEEKTNRTGMLNKYTPPEIYQEFRAGAEGERFLPAESYIHRVGQDEYRDLHLAFPWPVTRARALERRRQIMGLFGSAFECPVIVLTFGLVESWFDSKYEVYTIGRPRTDWINAEPDRFFYEVLSIDQCREYVFKTIDLLNQRGVQKKILISVSPVPLQLSYSGSDIVVANTYSKATLRAVSEEARLRYPNVDYFPSYEAVQFSHPDLSWARDRRHVTDLMVEINVLRLVEAYMPNALTKEEIKSKRDALMAEANEALATGRRRPRALRSAPPQPTLAAV